MVTTLPKIIDIDLHRFWTPVKLSRLKSTLYMSIYYAELQYFIIHTNIDLTLYISRVHVPKEITNLI